MASAATSPPLTSTSAAATHRSGQPKSLTRAFNETSPRGLTPDDGMIAHAYDNAPSRRTHRPVAPRY
ncbi:hypothetical protein GCM10010342_75790 [Streptomyces anulatus]|nr:hypothetical protein GCM10010342_75790 [Streptomyces anulatus]